MRGTALSFQQNFLGRPLMWVDVELFESLNVGLIAHSDRIKLELDYREIMKHFSSEKTFFHNAN